MTYLNNQPEDRFIFDYNEYKFYVLMPDSEVKENELGYYLKNHSIETYSYITPKEQGLRNFESFISFAFSFFSDGSEYFVIKIPQDQYYPRNSKILREKQFIKAFNDVNVMAWDKKNLSSLTPNPAIFLQKLNTKNGKRWVDVFFDAFNYPRNLRKYITRMVLNQMENGVEFYVGEVSGKDVAGFCAYKTSNIIGIYGVGTKSRFQRRGYAKAMLSNFILEKLEEKDDLMFCLQTNHNSGAERLYRNLGFDSVYIQKRFDWNPDIRKGW
ncbi:MAG: GNAT family N-acetyltransferase [Candidatus Heimdallarchaeaceae archaeon]